MASEKDGVVEIRGKAELQSRRGCYHVTLRGLGWVAFCSCQMELAAFELRSLFFDPSTRYTESQLSAGQTSLPRLPGSTAEDQSIAIIPIAEFGVD